MSGNIDANQQGQQQAPVSTTTSTGSTQMAVSSQIQVQQQPTTMQQAVAQQQLQQMQQSGTTGQHQQGGQNQMQQLQVVQQQIQNPTYIPQIYNTQGQQLIMPGNIALHHGLNSQIQVIAAGKSFQPNQLTGQHMLSTGNIGYTAIPTSGSPNNQTYILGQFINSPQSQLQHSGKHGEISKVISPQLGTQIPQGLWATSPHTFLTAAPNPIFIRGTQPDQMFIQQQQPIQTNAAAQQHFSMPLTAAGGQIPTSTVSTSNIQQGQQQQNVQGHPNQQQQNPQPVSIKPPATLQPKPLQIQPQPQHQMQQQQQLQQVTMTQAGGAHQIQMIPQIPPTSQTTVIPQSISITQQPQLLQQGQQQPRQLTILPQQTQAQLVQSQQMQFIQQQTTAPQAIRPNYSSSSVSIVTTQAPQTQQLANPASTTPQQRAKIRKPAVGRGAAANGPQQAKPVFPRASASASPVNSAGQQRQIQPQGMALGRLPVGTTVTQQNMQPLKTINLSALQGQGMADGTMISQANHVQLNLQQPNQILFPSTSTQLPSPSTTLNAPHIPLGKKDSTSEPSVKGDPEKENSKDQDEVQGKQKLPKAMVKPQVLTHVIEGFVIQEAAEPFPMPKSLDFDEPPKKKSALGGEFAKCEMCGKVELKAKFKRKKFCSSVCAKNMKAAQQKQPNQSTRGTQNQKGAKGRKWGESFEGGDTDETSSSVGDQLTMSENDGDDEPKVNPVKWDVNEVVDFVKSLPGCAEYAGDFAEQEIDGQALLLLKADHLMSAMNMKLGPALKLCAKIEAVRAGFGNGNAEPAK